MRGRVRETVVGVIANPVAGRGRSRNGWAAIEASIRRHFGEADFRETTEPGDACRLACAFAETAAPLVIAVGGDGTIGEVVDGLMQAAAEGHAGTALGVVPVGTGSDFAHGLGLPADREQLITAMAGERTRRIDVGRVTFVNDDGKLTARHFVNVASLGLSGPTDRRINAARRSGRAPGRALFLTGALLELLRYRFQSVRISVDDGEPVAMPIALVAVANGPCFGAGMRIAPDARLDDGLFDIVVLRATGKLGLFRDIRLVYRGAHLDHPAISVLRGRRVVVEPADDPLVNGALLDIDGESPGRIPATFELLPGALTLRC